MLISIVVPVYKVENYLHRCVDSILAQTFADYELILVDDGSPDNCGQICDEYAEKDSRIKVIHKQNGGLSDARNAGIDWCFENSDFEWITFIDSDDWVHPEYLQFLYNAVINTGCRVSVCSYQEASEYSLDFQAGSSIETVNTEQFYCRNNTNATVAWGKLYAKECFDDIRYPVGKLHEDEFTTYKIIFRYNDIAFIDSQLYYYFINDKSITKSPWNPRRIDSVQAREQCAHYLKCNGFDRAYNYCLQMLALNIVLNMKNLKEVYDKNTSEKYYKYLVTHLRKTLRICRKSNILEFKNYTYYYELAYPTLMKYYWLLISIKNKIFYKFSGK